MSSEGDASGVSGAGVSGVSGGTFLTAKSNFTAATGTTTGASKGRLVLKPVHIPCKAKKNTDSELFRYVLDGLVGYQYHNVEDNADRLR